MKCRSITLAAMGLLVVAHVRSQDPDPPPRKWPANVMMISLGRAVHAPMSITDPVGDTRGFRTRASTALGALEYQHATRNGWAFGAQAQLSDTRWRLDHESRETDLVVVERGINARQRTPLLPITFPVTELMLHVGRCFKEGERFRLEAGMLAGVVLALSSSWGVSLYTPSSGPFDTTVVRTFHAHSQSGRGAQAIVGSRIHFSWLTRNYHRWGVMLEGRSILEESYRGSFALYPSSTDPGSGKLHGRLAYVGVRIAYGFTWGEPRRPQWVRKLEERGLPLPSE